MKKYLKIKAVKKIKKKAELIRNRKKKIQKKKCSNWDFILSAIRAYI